MVLLVLAVISGILFLRYGFDVLFRIRLREEFTRYGMPRMRTVVGVLEMLGGAAVLFGLVFAPLGAFGAAGLTALMILGVAVRIRIHDAPRLMLPAACLGGLNAVLVVLFLSS
jgi:uncharacterized membrane protein YphA (DoxX/SURF4 family)